MRRISMGKSLTARSRRARAGLTSALLCVTLAAAVVGVTVIVTSLSGNPSGVALADESSPDFTITMPTASTNYPDPGGGCPPFTGCGGGGGEPSSSPPPTGGGGGTSPTPNPNVNSNGSDAAQGDYTTGLGSDEEDQVSQSPPPSPAPCPFTNTYNGNLTAMVTAHEGSRAHVYTDTLGHPTVGVGFNLDRSDAPSALAAVGANYNDVRAGRANLTTSQIDRLLDSDLDESWRRAAHFVPNFYDLNYPRQAALVDMAFNLGNKIGDFHQTIAYLRDQNFAGAAMQMANSRWAGQVGNRATELKNIIANCDGGWITPGPGPDPGWNHWGELNGAIVGEVSATWLNGSTEVEVMAFGRGTDNKPYVNLNTGTTWTGWHALDGAITSPITATTRDGGIDIVATAGGTPYYGRFNGTTWMGWQSLGGTVDDPPALASPAPGVTVAVARTGTTPEFDVLQSGVWSGWRALDGGITTSPVASASDGRVEIAATANGAPYYGWFNGTTWVGWQGLGGYIAGRPAIASSGNQTYVVGRGASNVPYATRLNGSWSGWQSLGGSISADPAATETHGSIFVTAPGDNGALYLNEFTTQWRGWDPIRGTRVASTAGITGTGFGTAEVVAPDSANLAPYQRAVW